jgi:hypothetical protein
MPKRRLVILEEDEIQRVLQQVKEKLPEEHFQVLQQVFTSYARLIALVREGTTPIERLRKMFKIKSCRETEPGDDRAARPERPSSEATRGGADG